MMVARTLFTSIKQNKKFCKAITQQKVRSFCFALSGYAAIRTTSGQGVADTRCKKTPPPREHGGFSVRWIVYTGDSQRCWGTMVSGRRSVPAGYGLKRPTGQVARPHPSFLGGWGLSNLPDKLPPYGVQVNRMCIKT